MLEVRYALHDEATGRAGFLRLAGGIWTGDVCGFEFADTVWGLAGTATCDWREPRPRLWVDDDAPGEGAQALLDRISALLLPFHRGAFRHLSQRDVHAGDPATRDAAELDRLLDQALACGAPGRVLEVGCTAGALLQRLAARGVDAVGFEVGVDALARADAAVRSRLRTGPVAALPYGPEHGFDTLLALDLFEHVPEHLLGAMVGEFARLGVRRVVARIAACEFHQPGHVTLRPLSWWDRQLAPWFHRAPLAQAATRAAAADGDPARYVRVYELASVPARS
ncbi:MAG: class I SAM-dependent methyltransferase [Planctomycetes bacterium]|nr:class I SAM-dependent methyltransferase [Planctomycetota bacterium]